MLKRLFDICASLAGLIVLAPVFLVVLFLVWRQDGKSPFYIAPRAGRSGRTFRMFKVRSMIVGADRSGVASTSAADARITPLGHFIRRWKIDELAQLWNVLRGDMSLVGPRPNTLDEAATYTAFEQRLLSVRPGITDFSSIVFSDEGEILRGAQDADAAYRELIWPWKSRFGVLYADHQTFALDIFLIVTTIVAIFDKAKALAMVARRLQRIGAPRELIDVARRELHLSEYQPAPNLEEQRIPR